MVKIRKFFLQLLSSFNLKKKIYFIIKEVLIYCFCSRQKKKKKKSFNLALTKIYSRHMYVKENTNVRNA
jgi:hypothetical protein